MIAHGHIFPLAVQVDVEDKDHRIQTALDNIRALMKTVGETHSGAAALTISWKGGRYGNAKTQRRFTFTKPGSYPVDATLRLDSRPRRFPLDSILDQRVNIPLMVMVKVQPPKADDALRTIRIQLHEPPSMVKSCREVFDYVMEFSFPVGGGPVTGFSHE